MVGLATTAERSSRKGARATDAPKAKARAARAVMAHKCRALAGGAILHLTPGGKSIATGVRVGKAL